MNTHKTDLIPKSLKQFPQWVLWKLENRRGKKCKIPYQPNGCHAQSNNPKTWSSFERIMDTVGEGEFNGIGFAFSKGDGLIGIDVDYPVDSEVALEIIEKFQETYCERSPSGKLRIFTKGNIPRCGKGNLDKLIEVYNHESPRYLTVTGDWLDVTCLTIENCQEAVDWLFSKYFTPPQKPLQNSTQIAPKNSEATSPAINNSSLSDSDILAIVSKAKNSTKFLDLYGGGGGNDQSSGDLALAKILAFYTQSENGGGVNQLDRLIRGSKRVNISNGKWDKKHSSDGRSYGQMTIEKAVSSVSKTYIPAVKTAPAPALNKLHSSIIHCTSRYLPKISFEESETTILHAPMGTGKTHGVPAWVHKNIGEDENFIAISPRITLIDSLINRFKSSGVELADYREANLNGNSYSISKLVICCNSLSKLGGLLNTLGTVEKTTVFIDEAEQVLRQLATMEELEGSFKVLKELVGRAKRVIVADAHGDLLFPFLDETRGDRSTLVVKSDYLPGHGRQVSYWSKSDALFDQSINTLKGGGRVLLATDSKEMTSRFAAAARAVCNGKGLVINSDSNHGKEELEFMQNPNGLVNSYQWVAYSPAVASGVSIDENDFKPFNTYCGFFSSLSGPNPEDSWQQIGRIRAPVDWEVFIDGRIEHKETDPDKILTDKSFKVLKKVDMLSTEKVAELEAMVISNGLKEAILSLVKDDYARIQVAVAAKEARLKNNFKQSHIALARAQGYKVKFVDDDGGEEASKVVAEATKLAKADFAEKVVNAESLTDKEFAKMESRNDLKPNEVYSKEKYHLEGFYGEVNHEVIKLDDRGKFRGVVRKIEELMKPMEEIQEMAVEGVKNILNKKTSIFHFKSHLLFRMVYLQILATAGYRFEEGKVRHDGRAVRAGELNRFIEWVESHHREVEIFHKIPLDFKERPIAFLQDFLGDLGLRLQSKKHWEGKRIVRSYFDSGTQSEKVNFWLQKRAVSSENRG